MSGRWTIDDLLGTEGHRSGLLLSRAPATEADQKEAVETLRRIPASPDGSPMTAVTPSGKTIDILAHPQHELETHAWTIWEGDIGAAAAYGMLIVTRLRNLYDYKGTAEELARLYDPLLSDDGLADLNDALQKGTLRYLFFWLLFLSLKAAQEAISDRFLTEDGLLLEGGALAEYAERRAGEMTEIVLQDQKLRGQG